MKLTVFGRDPQQADVVLSSTFVSGYHAELIQLDNGDMYLVDKSSNGTLLNGSKLVPGKETPVRRGDNVMFADVPLNWNQIEDLRLPANVKVVKTIGAHYTNDIKLQGAAVSRFHAALRQTNDGKWYICDYSKNGTTVNGRRIEKNNYVPLNAGDAIACAGVAVENPVKKKGAGKIIGISLAVLAVCAAIVLVVVIKPWPWSADKVYKEYNPSVLFMACGYHFEVECGALDISQIDDPNSIGQKLYSSFVIVDEDGEKYIQRYTGDNEMFGHATGFFIGKEGNIVTNLHVARPWLAETMSTSTGIKTIISVAEEHYRNKLSVLIELGYDNLIQYLPQLKVKGVLDYCIVIPNGNYCDLSNAYRCSEVIVSDNEEVDLAIMRLQQTYLPVGATYVPSNMITDKQPKLGEQVYTSGFPGAILEITDLDNKQVQVNSVSGVITKNDDTYSFITTAPIASGASGSPVFNKYGKLVGVMNAQIDGKQNYNMGIYSCYLLELIEKAKITK